MSKRTYELLQFDRVDRTNRESKKRSLSFWYIDTHSSVKWELTRLWIVKTNELDETIWSAYERDQRKKRKRSCYLATVLTYRVNLTRSVIFALVFVISSPLVTILKKNLKDWKISTIRCQIILKTETNLLMFFFHCYYDSSVQYLANLYVDSSLLFHSSMIKTTYNVVHRNHWDWLMNS